MSNALLSNERDVVGCHVELVAGWQVNPYILAAAITAALSFYGGWNVNQWRHDSEQKQAIEAAAVAQQELHRMEQSRSRATLDAQVLARKSEARLRSDAAASQSSLERLRDTSASALRATAGSLAACVAISATYDQLLTDSAGAYRELAAKADEHVIDLKLQVETP